MEPSDSRTAPDATGPIPVWPGHPYPLGATYDGAGTNFSLFSEVAEKVELCLIDQDGNETRIELDEVDGYVWHAYLPDDHTRPALRIPRVTARSIRPPGIGATRASYCSTRTASRSTAISTATGAVLVRAADPDTDSRDPAPDSEPAPESAGSDDAAPTDEPEDRGNEGNGNDRNRPTTPHLDSLGHTMTSVVINPFFDWASDRRPRRPYHETVIYEAHVKGMTADPPGHPRRSCAAPTPAWRTRRSSTTSSRSTSPPSN